MRYDRPRNQALCLLAALLSLSLSSSCAAQAKAGKGGKAAKAPSRLNVFIALDAKDLSGPLRDGVELAISEMHLPQAAGLAEWTDFEREGSGAVKLSSEERVGYRVLERVDAEADGSLRAYRLELEGAAASGGRPYAVSFAPADLAPSGLQPAPFAAVSAAKASGKAAGRVRVLGAKYEKGRFSYLLAVK